EVGPTSAWDADLQCPRRRWHVSNPATPGVSLLEVVGDSSPQCVGVATETRPLSVGAAHRTVHRIRGAGSHLHSRHDGQRLAEELACSRRARAGPPTDSKPPTGLPWRFLWNNPWTNAARRVHPWYPRARRYGFSTPRNRFLKRLDPGPRSTRRKPLWISSRMSSRPRTRPGEPWEYVRSNDERCSKDVRPYIGPTIQAIGVPSSSRAEERNSPSRARSSEEDA